MPTFPGKVFNPVCTVDFAGFRSDTLTLQRSGWQVSATQDPRMAAMRLALKHEGAKLYGITNSISTRAMYDHKIFERGPDLRDVFLFTVVCMASEIRCQIMPFNERMAWTSVDARPDMAHFEYKSIEDMVPFRPLTDEAKEIVVDPERVSEIMDLILKAQDPRQKEIRDRRRRDAWRESNDAIDLEAARGYDSHRDIRAQLICLGA